MYLKIKCIPLLMNSKKQEQLKQRSIILWNYRILLKYSNKSKEIDKAQKVEVCELKKPGRGKIETLLSKISYI